MGNGSTHWLTEDQYAKARWQFRAQLNEILRPLRMYGQDPYVDGAIEEVMHLVEDFGLRVRGVDKQLSIENIRLKRGYTPPPMR